MASHTNPLEIRSRHVAIKLTPPEADELASLAEALERSVSSLGRLIIREYLARMRAVDDRENTPTTEGGPR